MTEAVRTLQVVDAHDGDGRSFGHVVAGAPDLRVHLAVAAASKV